MKQLFRTFLMAAMAAAVVLSCDKEPNPTPTPSGETDPATKPENKALMTAQKFLRDDIMKTYYYWYRSVPDLQPDYKTDIYKYFDKLLWTGDAQHPYGDYWSWMMDGQEYIAEESGIQSGTFGASLGQPWMDLTDYFEDDYNIVVRYVYPNSPFDKAGVTRGCVLTNLDGKSVQGYYLSSNAHLQEFDKIVNYPSTTEYHVFEFKTPSGETISKSMLAAETLNTRPGLIKKIFTSEDYPGLTQPVGYFHYLAFKADDDANGKSMMDDITEAMAYFKANNVKTLILDLRYNGGGDSRASDKLVSYLAPKSANGEVYVKRTHNDKLKSEDKEQKVECPADSPEFNKLYFITGRGSASASEMSLNGLKPLANVKHVGDTTYGKPNGMYVFYYPGDNASYAQYDKGNFKKLKYVFLPICFYNANGLGENIPDDGMIPDVTIPDDLYHDFDASEMNIAACLYDIVHGSFPDIPKHKTSASRKVHKDKLMMFKSEEDSNEKYGTYIVKPDFL